MAKEKRPANSGNILYCPHCGERLDPHKNTLIRYCVDCGRGFAQHNGKITIYKITKFDVVAAEFEPTHVDFP